MNQVTLLFFASIKERAGLRQAALELPEGASVAELKAAVAAAYPALRLLMPTTIVALNQEFAYDEDLVPDGAVAAFFPPVSGGAPGPTVTLLTADALDINALVAQITLPTTGAACVFTGMVRGETAEEDGRRETARLEYEAYRPMAEAKLAQVALEIRARWPSVEGIVLVQRLGLLEAGTPTILVACSAAHRDTGVFEAARYGIDRIKEIVPIWKKEIGTHGETWIEGEYFPHQGD